jgi:hypothetical protein
LFWSTGSKPCYMLIMCTNPFPISPSLLK